MGKIIIRSKKKNKIIIKPKRKDKLSYEQTFSKFTWKFIYRKKGNGKKLFSKKYNADYSPDYGCLRIRIKSEIIEYNFGTGNDFNENFKKFNKGDFYKLIPDNAIYVKNIQMWGWNR